MFVAIFLSGCAAERAYNNGSSLYENGSVEEGLAQMKRAWQLDPENGDYKIQYYKRLNATVYRWLLLAGNAESSGNWDGARSYYEKILRVDPENPRARTHLNNIETEKNLANLLSGAQDLFDKQDLPGALKQVRVILNKSPSYPGALRLKRMIEAQIAFTRQPDVVLKSRLDHPITIEFKEAPLRNVFDSISRTAGVNFVFDKEVRFDSRVNLVVRDARIEDVIRFILLTNRLKQRVLNGNTLFIYQNTPQKLQEFQELQVKNFYLSNASAKDVAASIKGMLKPREMYVDDKLNMIVMRDTPDMISVAGRLIAAEDIAEPEVVLDVEVLEVGTNTLDNLGIQYPSQISFSAIGSSGTPGVLSLSELQNINKGMVRATIADPALVINLLHQDGESNLLANPKIRVKNHESASIHIGDKVPVITNTTTATGLVSQSVSYLDVGLKLDVQPTIYLQNDVGIKIGLEVSSINKQVQTQGGTLAYQIGTRNASTYLRLKDGETQMLAGLIDNEDRKSANRIPGIGQLPILGRLFSSNTDTSSRTEIVLLITPHVVRNIIPPGAPVEQFSSGTESDISLEQMEINPAGENGGGQPSGAKSSQTNAGPSPAAAGAKQLLPFQPDNAASNQPDQELPPGNAKLTLDAPPKVQANQPFTVKVNLAADGLQNVLLNVAYDPAKLKVVKVEEGDFLKKDGAKTQFMQQVLDKNGIINLGISRKGNVSGNGGVAVITFQPVGNAPGPMKLRVGAVNFSNAKGQVLPVVGGLPSAAIEIAK